MRQQRMVVRHHRSFEIFALGCCFSLSRGVFFFSLLLLLLFVFVFCHWLLLLLLWNHIIRKGLLVRNMLTTATNTTTTNTTTTNTTATTSSNESLSSSSSSSSSSLPWRLNAALDKIRQLVDECYQRLHEYAINSSDQTEHLVYALKMKLKSLVAPLQAHRDESTNNGEQAMIHLLFGKIYFQL